MMVGIDMKMRDAVGYENSAFQYDVIYGRLVLRGEGVCDM